MDDIFKELTISFSIGFAFSIILFSFGFSGENIIGFIMAIVLIGFMVGGAIFFGWRFKENLRN